MPNAPAAPSPSALGLAPPRPHSAERLALQLAPIENSIKRLSTEIDHLKQREADSKPRPSSNPIEASLEKSATLLSDLRRALSF